LTKPRRATLLAEVLSTNGYADELVDDMAASAAARVWWAAFERRNLPDERAERLQSSLRHILHWAIHIGQSAWRLLHLQPPVPSKLEEWPVEWTIIVDELYCRPFIMMDMESQFHDLLIASDTLRQPWLSGSGLRKRWDRHAIFTRARLARIQSQEGCGVEQAGLDSLSSVSVQVVTDLRANASLYLEFLKWLVSSREKNKIKISDCMVNLCALALRMSGDALRLIWPI